MTNVWELDRGVFFKFNFFFGPRSASSEVSKRGDLLFLLFFDLVFII